MEKVNVIFKETARISIRDIALYIEMKRYRVTAEKFVVKLYEFGYYLTIFHNKFPICRNQQYAKRLMHCAVFKRDYVFVYKTIGSQLIIYNIIHCRRL